MPLCCSNLIWESAYDIWESVFIWTESVGNGNFSVLLAELAFGKPFANSANGKRIYLNRIREKWPKFIRIEFWHVVFRMPIRHSEIVIYLERPQDRAGKSGILDQRQLKESYVLPISILQNTSFEGMGHSPFKRKVRNQIFGWDNFSLGSLNESPRVKIITLSWMQHDNPPANILFALH